MLDHIDGRGRGTVAAWTSCGCTTTEACPPAAGERSLDGGAWQELHDRRRRLHSRAGSHHITLSHCSAKFLSHTAGSPLICAVIRRSLLVLQPLPSTLLRPPRRFPFLIMLFETVSSAVGSLQARVARPARHRQTGTRGLAASRLPGCKESNASAVAASDLRRGAEARNVSISLSGDAPRCY